ncbi:MAG: hypothetical protein M2R45_01480 [Verrucomicrobia subdivision 3 bacterium]|nr:hypothetical protein [Limisphaerales bacterium]MCS1413390.1 hypothetical protein [Limisphaerales bacterium]
MGRAIAVLFWAVMYTAGLSLGVQIRMRTDCGNYTGVVGEILEVDPPPQVFS